jgi:alpha-galactosidase
VLALNTLDVTAKREIKWSEVPQLENGCSYEVEDIWSGKKLGCVKEGISRQVVSHDTIGFLVGKKCGGPGKWW